MTQSQLDHYQIEAKSLKLHATSMTSKTFKEFITEFLRCFEVNIKAKKLLIEIEDQILERPQAICTDLKIYKDILFHIVSNAVKFSKQG
jgi:signal transduction histidine kinase